MTEQTSTTTNTTTTTINHKKQALDGPGSEDETILVVENGEVVNHSGYRDQLKRQYGLLGIAGIALTVDNAWVALGSSISVSICTFVFLDQFISEALFNPFFKYRSKTILFSY